MSPLNLSISFDASRTCFIYQLNHEAVVEIDNEVAAQVLDLLGVDTEKFLKNRLTALTRQAEERLRSAERLEELLASLATEDGSR